MDKKIEKLKAFVKENKVAVGAAVYGVIVFALTKHKPDAKKVVDYIKPESLEVPKELVKYGVNTVYNYSGAVELVTAHADVAVAELGKIGEALCKIPEIKPENKAYVLINIAKDIGND